MRTWSIGNQNDALNAARRCACKVARAAFDSYVKRFSDFNATASWSAEDKAKIAFSIKGASIKGDVDVTDTNINIDLEVPFLLRPFKDMAMGKVKGEIDEWIAKAKRGEIGD